MNIEHIASISTLLAILPFCDTFRPSQVSLVYRNTSPTNYMEFTIFVLFL